VPDTDRCGVCGKELFRAKICRKCNGTFCDSHSSPRKHDCPAIKRSTSSGRSYRQVAIPVAVGGAAIVLMALWSLTGNPSIEPGPPWEGTISFTDVSNGSGLMVSESGHGLGVDDLDGDLDMDLYVVNKNGNHFFMNNGDGTFTDMTVATGVGEGPGGGHGVAIGDYDNDGDRDIFSANWAGGLGSPNLLYRNEGNFNFTDVTVDSGLEVGDPGQSHSACMGDYNNDGWLDIIATNVGAKNFYFQNRRNGMFLYSSDLGTGQAPHGLVTSDYDLDGDLDVYLSDQAWEGEPAGNVFYENKDGRSFLRRDSQAGLRGETHSSFFGDFDGDGDYDFFGIDRGSNGEKAYYRNTGNGFRDVSSQVGAFGPHELVHGMDCADFDLDGDLDVLLTAVGDTILLANRGGGHFEDITVSVGLDIDFGDPKSVCFFDFDEDGDQDVYVVCASGYNRLFESRGNTNNWLKINLRGIDSNRDGIGAHLEIRSGDLVQFREVPSGRGHIHDPIEQVIGLGECTGVDSIRILWPSGLEQELIDLPANSRILITEGEGWTSLS